MIGYVCAYLRYYYPIEFCTALLNNANNDDDLVNGTALIKQLGIKLKNPIFRHARSEYFCDKINNIIYKGLNSIKFMSADVAEELYSLKDNQYKNFIDVLYALESTSINSRQLEILIKIGYFNEFGQPNALLEGVKVFNLFKDCKKIKIEKLEQIGLNIDILDGCYNKKTPKTISEIDNRKLILRILKNEQLPKTTIVDKIKYQLEWLGYSELNDVKQPMTIWIVTDISTTSYGTQYVTMYNICYGVSKTYRINKAFWTKHPFAISDVIECCFREKDKYIKDENGNFKSTGEKILELKAWKSVENIA